MTIVSFGVPHHGQFAPFPPNEVSFGRALRIICLIYATPENPRMLSLPQWAQNEKHTHSAP
jgi:hypothetical protein